MLTSDKFYRSFVLLPCEICVVPFGHRKIAADWNDISLATNNTSLRSSRCRFDCIIVESILSQKACKHAFRHASPQSCLCVASSFRHGGWAARPAAGHKIDAGRKKELTHCVSSFFLTGSYLSSQAASSQVLSTYKGLTTVFGMGTGGSP